MAGTKVKKIHHGVAMTEEHVGQEADVTIFSFQAVKNLPTADSGMICFKDNEDDKLVRQLSWLGIDKDTYSRSTKGSYKWKYDVPNIGFKYNGNSIMASIGLVQLQYLDEDNNYRNYISSLYRKYLNSDINIVEDNWYVLKSSKHLFQIRVNEDVREKLINKLYGEDIYPGVHYVDNTTYKMYKYAYGTCPNSHKFSNQLLTLPIHLDLTEYDIKRISKIINKYG